MRWLLLKPLKNSNFAENFTAMGDNGKTIYQGFSYELKEAEGLTIGKTYSAALYSKTTQKRFLAEVNSEHDTSAEFTADGSISFKWVSDTTSTMEVGAYVLEVFSSDREEIIQAQGFTVVPSNVMARNATT